VKKTTSSTAKPKPKSTAGQDNIHKRNAASKIVGALRVEEFLDALERLGIINQACKAVGADNSMIYNQIVKDPTFADRLAEASARGKARRRDYLESLAYKIADEGNPTMVMFLLKREDPSYRESYNVNQTSQPTDYIIDLGLPENPAPLTDVTPTTLLAE